MTQQEIDRIECAIRHIQSSLDVDPWAMDIAVAAMKKELKNSTQQLKNSTQPQRWIPCSEKLPEESGLYIVTNVGRWVEPVGTRYYNIRADGGFWSGHPGDKVLAWMPLPEPYKGDET